jgi:hypothetical protein
MNGAMDAYERQRGSVLWRARRGDNSDPARSFLASAAGATCGRWLAAIPRRPGDLKSAWAWGSRGNMQFRCMLGRPSSEGDNGHVR